MEPFLSKKEIEILIREYKDTPNLYSKKENVIAQIFAIKIYNLMKTNYDLASSYINKVLEISSICKDIDLNNYYIKDIKMFLTIENNILSGFIFGPKKNENTYFSNVIQIKNNFISTIPKQDIRPLFLENIIKEFNLTCLTSFSKNVNEELNKRVEENFNDRFLHNMYIEYQFRKNEFLNLPLSKNEKLLLIKHYIKDEKTANKKILSEPYVEKYIIDMFKDRISEYANLHIYNLIKNLKTSMSNKILDMDFIYDQIIVDIDQLIIDLLYTPICGESIYRKKPLVVLDWLIIKDDIFEFIKKKNNEICFKNFFKHKIIKLNMIYIDIYNEIKSKCQDYDILTVNYGYSVDRICKNKLGKILNRGITIDNYAYRCTFIGFTDINDNFFALDNNFKIDDILNLKITHGNTLLYSVPEKTKDLLIKINNEILSALNKNGHTLTDHCKLKRVEDLKI